MLTWEQSWLLAHIAVGVMFLHAFAGGLATLLNSGTLRLRETRLKQALRAWSTLFMAALVWHVPDLCRRELPHAPARVQQGAQRRPPRDRRSQARARHVLHPHARSPRAARRRCEGHGGRRRHFSQIGCGSCHLPRLKTASSDIAGLRDQVIRPYTDLLLHDMGAGLADGRPDGLASGSEWRTAPLWGIGLVRTVNRHTRFLHDGRARNLSEAILWHGGEARSARERFRQLPIRERRELVSFLESL